MFRKARRNPFSCCSFPLLRNCHPCGIPLFRKCTIQGKLSRGQLNCLWAWQKLFMRLWWTRLYDDSENWDVFSLFTCCMLNYIAASPGVPRVCFVMALDKNRTLSFSKKFALLRGIGVLMVSCFFCVLTQFILMNRKISLVQHLKLVSRLKNVFQLL